MASYAYRQEPSAPPMQTEGIDRFHPILPVRSDLNRHPQEETLLPAPRLPQRMDEPSLRSPVDTGSRRDDNEENTGDANIDSPYNYNSYATKKTIGHSLLIIALITSNVMQLRMLILQKQHDGVWIASLVLVCVSMSIQIGLGFILFVIIKGDIRNPQKQEKLERYNTLAFVIIIFVSILNIIINVFMLTTNPRSFLDTHSLELLQKPI